MARELAVPRVLCSFAFAGLLLEVAITGPVGAGFGRPTLYFSLHGLIGLLEQHGWTELAHLCNSWKRLRRECPMIASGCVCAAVFFSSPLCFAADFRTEVALPLACAVGDYGERGLLALVH